MRLLRALFCSMILTSIDAGVVFYPFTAAYNETCSTRGDKGIYTTKKNCAQANLLSRVGRENEIKYAGVDVELNEFVVCCDPRVIMVSTTASRLSDSEEHCHDYCRTDYVVDEHIIGGVNATVGEFMHMAAIGYFNDETTQIDFNCGGVLLNEKFVLTAAHCTNKVFDTPYMVRLGRVSCNHS